jgi:hypothetical protein
MARINSVVPAAKYLTTNNPAMPQKAMYEKLDILKQITPAIKLIFPWNNLL